MTANAMNECRTKDKCRQELEMPYQPTMTVMLDGAGIAQRQWLIQRLP